MSINCEGEYLCRKGYGFSFSTMLCLHKIQIGKLDHTIMKTKLSIIKDRRTRSQVFFIIFKLPALLITPVLGFIIEFIYELPFMLVCLLDSRLRK
jgi:hypothetical protein